MIQVTKEALNALCYMYQTNEDSLTFLGGGQEHSDGIVYTYNHNNKKMVLKILVLSKEESYKITALDERLEFIHFLGMHGIQISYPIPNLENKLYATYLDEKYLYIAYSMNFCEGELPKTERLTTHLSYHWGKLIGKSHRLAKQYPIWKKLSSNVPEYGYLEELEFFTNWCENDEVKVKWIEMKKKLSALPINRNSYGFIHNDNHQKNIIVRDSKITLIDFDCACPQFFLHDIVVPVQGIMFDLSGGIFNNVQNKDPLKKYFDEFINGYETENHLDTIWFEHIDTFINYRRQLLFTCMQEFIENNKELKQGFLEMIKEPPLIFSNL